MGGQMGDACDERAEEIEPANEPNNSGQGPKLIRTALVELRETFGTSKDADNTPPANGCQKERDWLTWRIKGREKCLVTIRR